MSFVKDRKEYDEKFQSLYHSVSTNKYEKQFIFRKEETEKLQEKIRQRIKTNSSRVQRMSQFARSLQLVDDLFVATDYAFQQYEKTAPKTSQTTQQPPQNKMHQKRDKTEIIDTTADDEGSQPNKKAKKLPFQSAKDKFKQEGGKLEPNDEKGSNDGSNRMKREDSLPPELAMYDKALIEKIESDIIHHGQPVRFDDISGLQFAKKTVQELICWPMKAPELFTGLRSLPRGILLFGPPGTGKTLIGKAIAHQSGATFFSISSSSLMSKWIGEGEKSVRTLFAVASYMQPSVVFIDEVDSLLTQRSSEENEATRRIKTEFMVQLDGANTSVNSRVVILGATNRPEELDEAVRRRFVKRLYIPLPDIQSRKDLIQTLLKDERHELSESQISEIMNRTEGFSGADIRSLCTEAAMGPLRELMQIRNGNFSEVAREDLLPIRMQHFIEAFDAVKPSVSQKDLQRYIDWNDAYGSYRFVESEVNELGGENAEIVRIPSNLNQRVFS